MALPTNLISKFVKATKDDKKVTKKETIAYGTITVIGTDGKYRVRLDGSKIDTPAICKTSDVSKDNKVMVMIKNHSLIITGNISDPALTADGNTSTVRIRTQARKAVDDSISAISTDYINSLWDDYD